MSALDDLLAEVEDVIGGGDGTGVVKRRDAPERHVSAAGREEGRAYTSSSYDSSYRGSSYQSNTNARAEDFAGSRSNTGYGGATGYTSSYGNSKYDSGHHKEDKPFDVSLYTGLFMFFNHLFFVSGIHLLMLGLLFHTHQ